MAFTDRLILSRRRVRPMVSAILTLMAAVAISGSAGAQTRRPLPVPADPSLPTLFLIGDSTVRNGQGDGGGGQWGWGEPLVDLFDKTRINVVNRAVGGLSSRTYLTGGHWERVLAMLRPGDFVLMQFGHNDAGPLNDDSRARGTIRGTGDEAEEIDNQLTGQHETVHTYGWYLRKFIAGARAKGATPIVCSPVPRKSWQGDKIARSKSSYAAWAADVARTEKAPFVDLYEIIARRYDALGPAKVEPLFGDPHTHTSRAGAELNAESVVAGLKALPDDPLASYLSPKGRAVPVYQSSARTTAQTPDPHLPTLFVVGDSTASNSGRRGWGDPLADYFDAAKINVVNRARGGRSSRTYTAEGLWDRVAGELKPGDFVLIQFGHNDGGPVAEKPARGSLPGLGDETREVTTPAGAHETVHTYGWYLRRFLTDTKAKGAHPILLSLTVRNIWKNNKVERGPGRYGAWTREIAEAQGVPFVPVSQIIADRYEQMGPEKVAALFPVDHTHTSPEGADLNASLVVAGLKGIGSPLVRFLSSKGEAVPAAKTGGA